MVLEIIEADLSDPAQGAAVVGIVDAYARGPGGQNAPLDPEARDGMVAGLLAYPASLVLLAYVDGTAVGVATCFWGFSTWAGKPSINIHDLAVLGDYQGRGIGSALIEAVAARARAKGCCKVTLEVLKSNTGARRLYERMGFGSWGEDGMLFVAKRI